MKSIPLFSFLLFMILNLPAFCQDEDGQQIVVYKVPAHNAVNKMPWYNDVYRFSDFQSGNVVYASRRKDTEALKLNYNLYYEKMECINEKGDTVLLKTGKLKFVNIGGTTFLFDNVKGFIEIVADAPVALGVKTFMATVKMDYVSGSVGSWVSNGQQASPSVNHEAGFDLRTSPSVYDRYYKKGVSYFFIDRKTSVHKAIKPSILKIFAPYAEKITEYLETNPVDFNRHEDLIRLLTFCHHLRHT
jgi:hypothetical protein